ncbi:MAG: deoxyribose-phosphate aldolase [Polyangiaceae bacterium]
MADGVAIGADHGGYALKEHLAGWLRERGHRVVDCGTHGGAACDYPVIAAEVARQVAEGHCARGIIIDGAGIGSAMMANRFPGVRAALCYDLSSANNAREHNDANVLTLGARLIGEGLAEQIAHTFLTTICTEERHHRRVAMIDTIAAEASCCTKCPPSGGPPTGLAGKGGTHHNAPPDDDRSRAFRARSARFLMDAHPSGGSPQTMDKLDQLSSEDLDRVAARIAQMMAAGEARNGMWCFGDVCIDARAAQHFIDAGVARLSNGLGNVQSVRSIAKYIDHTLLKPTAQESEIRQLCAEAREHEFASVCVNPAWVRLCAELLRGSPVVVCTVVGFPLGATVSDIKAMETRRAIRDGAKEIDMVINIGALKGGDDETVFKDIRAVVDACEDGRALSKVIIETALLSDEEKVRACVAARRARADFVKTSTGFASGGATAEDVALMARVVADTKMGVKASGGVRSLADLDQMVRAGATRIGASAGVKIMKEAGG